MPAYNFQERFVEPIWMRTKRHTIRMPRKRPTLAGDWIYMYTGLRTKQARKFAESIVVDVRPIWIFPYDGDVQVPAKPGLARQLSDTAIDKLAREDGFEHAADFFDFFRRIYKADLLPFEIIEWDIDRLVRC